MENEGVSQEMVDEAKSFESRKMLADVADDAIPDLLLALRVACSKGYKNVADAILAKGVVDLETRDPYGWTLLHLAAFWDSHEVIVALVEHGADITARTRNEETPYDLAVDRTTRQLIRGACIDVGDARGGGGGGGAVVALGGGSWAGPLNGARGCARRTMVPSCHVRRAQEEKQARGLRDCIKRRQVRLQALLGAAQEARRARDEPGRRRQRIGKVAPRLVALPIRGRLHVWYAHAREAHRLPCSE